MYSRHGINIGKGKTGRPKKPRCEVVGRGATTEPAAASAEAPSDDEEEGDPYSITA